MQYLPTTKQLQYLRALDQTGHFRHAAELCHVTQPTLSAGIQEIERLLGLPLIDRSRRKKIIFTPFGLEVLESAKQVLPALERLSDKARQMSQPLSGPLRLGLIPTMAPYLLPGLLPKLEESFAEIDFQIVENMSANLVRQLHEGTIDIALMAFPYDMGDLEHKVFFEEPFFCASKKQTFKTGRQLSLEDLDGHKLLLLEDGHCLREHALSACKIQSQADKKTLSATSLLTLIQMVNQGHGITLLPEMVIKAGSIPANLDIHGFKDPLPTRKVGAAWRRQDLKMQDIQIILDHIEKTLT